MSDFIDNPTNKSQDILTALNIRTPEEIAIKLKNLGIRGRRHDRNSCPIALYLNRRTGYVHAVDSDFYMMTDKNGNRHSDVLPQQVQKFVNRFDKGKYPELINE